MELSVVQNLTDRPPSQPTPQLSVVVSVNDPPRPFRSTCGCYSKCWASFQVFCKCCFHLGHKLSYPFHSLPKIFFFLFYHVRNITRHLGFTICSSTIMYLICLLLLVRLPQRLGQSDAQSYSFVWLLQAVMWRKHISAIMRDTKIELCTFYERWLTKEVM